MNGSTLPTPTYRLTERSAFALARAAFRVLDDPDLPADLYTDLVNARKEISTNFQTLACRERQAIDTRARHRRYLLTIERCLVSAIIGASVVTICVIALAAAWYAVTWRAGLQTLGVVAGSAAIVGATAYLYERQKAKLWLSETRAYLHPDEQEA
jgi:hypothetical protein